MNQNFVYIINDLRRGGTNKCFYRLIKSSNDKSDIICINKKDYYYDELTKNGNRVLFLNTSDFRKFISSLLKIINILKRKNNYIINCWLYKSCLTGFIFSIFFKKKLIWNIRHAETNLNIGRLKKFILIRLCALISNIKDLNIIYNSYYSQKNHEIIGFNKKNSTVINNCFETNKYSFKNNKDNFIQKYQIAKGSFIFSMYGRFHPIKNHKIFFEAISKIVKEYPFIHIFLAGRGITEDNIKLKKLINFFKLENKITLSGLLNEKNLIEAYSASDITVLTSISESFPNVIGESMSCSTPCIAFDVGDCKSLIGNTGWVTKKNNLPELIINLKEAINLSKDKKYFEKKRNQCNLRITNFYNSEMELSKYKKFYKSCI